MSEMMETTTREKPVEAGVLGVLKESLGVPPSRAEAAIKEAIGIGRRITSVVPHAVWNGLTSRDSETGAGTGVLSHAKDRAVAWVKRSLFSKGGVL